LLTRCEFLDNTAVGRGGGASSAFHATPIFDYCLFAGNSVTGADAYHGGAAVAVIYNNASAELNNCTFSADSAAGAGGIVFCASSCSASLDKCIMAFGRGGGAVYWDGTGTEPALTCCDLYGNVGGDWVGAIADQYGLSGNISEDPLFCNAAASNFYLQSDSPCLDTDWCGTMGVFGECPSSPASVDDVRGDELAGFRVYAARPSPFRGSTRIGFVLPAADWVSVAVFDVRGALVAMLADEQMAGSNQTVIWDGVDSRGNEVAAGTYFARITVGNKNGILKMILLR
jgi:hypothetical protein